MPLRGSRAAGPWGRLPPPLLLVALAACAARASEITFELPDNAKQCFYEEIVQGTKCTLEFQVPPGPGAASRPGAWPASGERSLRVVLAGQPPGPGRLLRAPGWQRPEPTRGSRPGG